MNCQKPYYYWWNNLIEVKKIIGLTCYTNVIYMTGQCLRNHTVVNADGYTCLVSSGEAKIGLLYLSIRDYWWNNLIEVKKIIGLTCYTNVIYKTGQCLRNHTVVNADGYTCLVSSGEAKIELLYLSIR